MQTNNNISIFLPSDNNYAPFIATTIAGICDNTKAYCDFYILDSGISEENQNKICKMKEIYANFSIEFLKINLEENFKNLNVFGHLNLSTYNRLLIPKLKPELQKVLYMDSDVVVIGDIMPLYNTDLEDYALAAAWNKSRKFYNTDTFELLELSDDYKYFNAGVLLIDIQKWVKDNIAEKLFEIENTYKSKILHADETLLNKYFDNNYKIFDIKYNYLDYDAVNSPDSEIIIRHFATPFKPWVAKRLLAGKKVIELKCFDDFWRYAKITPFYEEIVFMYNKNINKNPLIKRFNKEIN